MNEWLCYYSCYFGSNHSESNVIKNIPSKIYDCYYFTNTIDTYKQLKETDWKSIFVPVSVKMTLNVSFIV